MMKNKHPNSGRIVISAGSRQQKVYTARKDKVWEGCFHEKSQVALSWNTKTMPILKPISSGTEPEIVTVPCIEASEIVGHEWQAEVWPFLSFLGRCMIALDWRNDHPFFLR